MATVLLLPGEFLSWVPTVSDDANPFEFRPFE